VANEGIHQALASVDKPIAASTRTAGGTARSGIRRARVRVAAVGEDAYAAESQPNRSPASAFAFKVNHKPAERIGSQVQTEPVRSQRSFSRSFDHRPFFTQSEADHALQCE
jgi:hypothetical protein